MTACLLYVTVPNREEAESIAEVLVRERLAACVNIHGPTTSVYEWNGQLQRDTELVLIIKTQARLGDRVTDRVVELHSYECPCVLNLPVQAGLSAYLEWVEAQTTVPTAE